MDVREKLVELLTDNLPRCGNLPRWDNPLQLSCDEQVQRIADHLIMNGVTVLPVQVGDRLYEVTGRKTISVYKVKAIRVELFGLFIEWDIVEGFVWQSLSGINAGEIGKTVFLSHEEAEKALEAMKK